MYISHPGSVFEHDRRSPHIHFSLMPVWYPTTNNPFKFILQHDGENNIESTGDGSDTVDNLEVSSTPVVNDNVVRSPSPQERGFSPPPSSSSKALTIHMPPSATTSSKAVQTVAQERSKTTSTSEKTGLGFDSSTKSSTTSLSVDRRAEEEVCDDDPEATFFVTATGKDEPCIWLAARPIQQEIYCAVGQPASSLCRETCGSCSDKCIDQKNRWFLHEGIQRNCLWLSLRSHIIKEVCVPGHEALAFCPETCNSPDCNFQFEYFQPSTSPSAPTTAPTETWYPTQTWYPTITDSPTETDYPTISPEPSITPYPTETDYPTESEFPSISFSPTSIEVCQPNTTLLFFLGIEEAVSFNKGKVSLKYVEPESWYPVDDSWYYCGEPSYDILVAPAVFEFSSIANMSSYDLIDFFQDPDRPGFKHIETNLTELVIEVEPGLSIQLLVLTKIVETESISFNREVSIVQIAELDPVVKEDFNRYVEIPRPNSVFNITFNRPDMVEFEGIDVELPDILSTLQEGDNTYVLFNGPSGKRVCSEFLRFYSILFKCSIF